MDTANSAAFRSHGPGDIPEDGADNDDDADLPDPASQSMISASDTDASDLSYRPRPQHKEDLLRGVKTILMHPVQGIFKLLESVPSPLSRRRAPRASDGHPMHTPLAAWNDRATSHRKTFFTSLAEICVSSWLNILLLFVPLGIGSYFAHLSPMMIFVSNAIAIIPLSAIMTDATERIAAQAGDTVGALLNISLGNLVELILFIVALANNHIRIVQASILGSILVNLLLILGTALLAGSAINSEPTYNTAEAQLLACLLFVSVFTFLMPAAFDHTYKDTTDTAKAVLRMSRLSSILTLLIYVYYFVHELRSRSGASGEAVPTDALDIENGRTSLEVTEYNRNLPDVTLAPRTIRFADEAGSRRPRTPLASHRIELDDLRAAEPDDSEDEALENQRPGSSYQSHSRSTHRARSLSLNSNSSAHEDARRFPRSGLTNLQMLRDSRIDHDQEQLLTQQQQHRHHHHHHHHHHLQTAHSSKKGEMFTCAFVLVLTSVTMSISAEFLVSAIDDVTHQSHLSESVIGLIILPIVGNIAEYVTVVTVAVRDKLDLAIAVSVGSAIQIALCVTPLTVIAGWILRKNLALSFNFFEMATLFGSVLLVNLLILNETSRSLRTSGLKGALMCTCYLIIGLGAYFTVES